MADILRRTVLTSALAMAAVPSARASTASADTMQEPLMDPVAGSLPAHAPGQVLGLPATSLPVHGEPVAELVVELGVARVLHASNPRVPLHPASLTKLMTLMLCFEALQSNRVGLHTPVPISARAAARPATHLGIAQGSTIELASALAAMAVHSCNDVATAVAELLGGDEDAFAVKMTSTARSLGMASTRFTTASGLPDPLNESTAADLVLLGATMMTRYPQYWPVLGIRQWSWNGHVFDNTNRMLSSYPGMEGGKTGYTRASGFHLLASVHRGGRHVMALVAGYHSAALRDQRMAALLDAVLGPASLHDPEQG